MIKLTKQELQDQNTIQQHKPIAYAKMLKYDEKLARGESVANIQLQYKYVCNFKCQHCSISQFQQETHDRRLTLKDIANLSQQADELGLAHFTISGGEPSIFSDLENLVQAIDPDKFWIQCDTNGWNLTPERANHWKDIGIDKIDLSLDSMNKAEHDSFRNTPGSWDRAVRAIDSAIQAGLKVLVNTVLTKGRVQTQEFRDFCKFITDKGAIVMVCYAHPVGSWEGNYDVLVTDDDVKVFNELCEEYKYKVFEHSNLRAYDRHIGCFAVKRLISVTQSGDFMACPWLYLKLGNIFDTTLKDILKKGMKYFGEFESTCLIGNNRKFIDKYVTQTYGKPQPVAIEDVLPLNWRDTL